MPDADQVSASDKPNTTQFDVYSTMSSQPASSPGRFVVRFWNLSASAMTLKIDGQSVELPKGQSRLVETKSEFTWQIEGRASEVSRVPADARGATVAIRR
jgi:hypothetical protein